MSPAILGRKVGMTRVYDEKGKIVPVTVIQAGPCVVTQVKTADGRDGYNAVQIGFETINAKYSTIPEIGHAAKAGVGPQRFFREVRLKAASDKNIGDSIEVNSFEGVAHVDVIGVSKGKGFAGVMKRYNFGGFPASHGTERKHRARGSIASYGTQRGHCGKPKKGLRMAGHMGDVRVTTRNHPLVRVDAENGVLLVKGALPGANGSLLYVRKSVTAKVKA
ncbi:MAG: rplC [Phycisphaerales bacterium]|nr:rplC [Phycisphaerales bacterium]